MWKDKTDHETIWGHSSHDIKKDLMETGRNTMDKNGFPEIPDKNNLDERPDAHQNDEKSIKGKRRAFDKFCS
jgi:hypothetical protein